MGDVPFGGLTVDWAVAVARNLDEFAGDRVPLVDELWVASDLALHVRYRIARDRLAGRFVLDVDPTSALAPTDAGSLASILLHDLHAPAEYEWVDGAGYIWWGDRPTRGWTAVDDGQRLLTLR